MTHIEQMIQDMCPNGVEWKTLGEVCDVYTGGEPPIDCIKTKAPEGDYIYPIYSNGVGDNAIYGFAKTYTINERAVTFSSIGTIGHPTLREGKFTPIIRLKVIIPKDDSSLNISFVKYALDVAKFSNNKSSLPNINAQMLKQIEIPLPPLEIQKKIVECLDKFSALAAELQAELQMRRKQYEYYRTQLLTPHSDCNSADKTDDAQWEWKTLGEIFELRGGYTPSKNKPEFWEEGTIPWFRMEDIRENGRILKDAILHISPIAVKGQGLFEKDSFVLATSATIGEHALLAVDALTNQRFTNLKVRKQYKSVLYTKFIFYYMFKVDEFCKAHTNISGFESVDMDALRKMPFPIPPLSEQIRIADLLDKFEALTTSLSDGIPAEQAAQQKRYEYYRDLLLTFDRKAV